ncbi:MAG: 50S ribosomal protein L1 [Chloroflexi bacterium]|nr:50S ribosomal protein L1 [Chloroflexota bacterium]
MVKRGTRYATAQALVVEDREYEPRDAVALAKQTATAKFDETVELHMKTGADPRHSEQMVRGVTVLPHGVGKQVRVAVFTQGEAVSAAEKAGADFVGGDDLIQKVQGGWVDFDVSIATPDMMGKVGKLGPILGRRGLMPNPRAGTVVQPAAIAGAIDEAKKGRIEFRLDRTALIHVPIGKASFEDQQLLDNLTAVVENIVRARPSSIKGQYIRSAYLSTTMGPSIPMNVASTVELKVE